MKSLEKLQYEDGLDLFRCTVYLIFVGLSMKTQKHSKREIFLNLMMIVVSTRFNQ